MTTSPQLSQLLNPTGREKTPEQAPNSNHINRKEGKLVTRHTQSQRAETTDYKEVVYLSARCSQRN